MNFDPELLKQLSSIDQRELSRKIDEISQIIGADSRRIKQMVGDPEELRRKIGELSDEDIRRITSRIDPETLNKINKKLGE